MRKIIFLSILSVLILLGCSGSRKAGTDAVDLSAVEKANTFAIMPFEEPETYPYASDRMREALIFAFMQKGYQVETNEALWDSLVNQSDYLLYNLNESQAREVAKKLNVDMLIFGDADFRTGISSNRSEGLYQERTIEKPILIKAYDLRSNEILLRERIPTRSFWGLSETEKNYRMIAKEFVDKLKAMGYIQKQAAGSFLQPV